MDLHKKAVKVSEMITELVDELEFTDAEFLTQEEYDDCSDAIYDAPGYLEHGKYGTVDDYAIMKIEKGGTLTVIGRGECNTKKTIDLGNLDSNEVIELCSSL